MVPCESGALYSPAMLTVSDTAYSIAEIRARESERPEAERLFEDAYARVFAAAGAHAAEGTARFLGLPFFQDGIRLRTRAIDDFVRDGLAEGLTQIVLLGAGFDARGMRMPEIARAGAKVFEVDFPALLEAKRALLDGAGVAVPDYVVPVACDFADDFDAALTSALEARGFRPGAGAIFLWEGVIAYIDRSAIDRSLRFMARAGGPRTRLVVDYGSSAFEPEGPLARALAAGFTRFDEVKFDVLWRRYLPGEPHEGAYWPRLGSAFV